MFCNCNICHTEYCGYMQIQNYNEIVLRLFMVFAAHSSTKFETYEAVQCLVILNDRLLSINDISLQLPAIIY